MEEKDENKECVCGGGGGCVGACASIHVAPHQSAVSEWHLHPFQF